MASTADLPTETTPTPTTVTNSQSQAMPELKPDSPATSAPEPTPETLAASPPPPQTPPTNPFESIPTDNVISSHASTPSPVPVLQPAPADAIAPAMPQRPTQVEQAPPSDPRVAGLRSMFPDFDDTLLLTVLESVGWDQDRAIDTLLGMNDPEYKSTTQPTAQQSQTDLDEQLARRLMIEEQEQQQAAWRAAHPQPPAVAAGLTPGGGRTQYQTYPQQQQQGPGSEGPSITADLQEQFNKVAEAGKKTFGNLFSKVKAKMQEFDSPRQPSGPGSTQPNWGNSSASAPFATSPTSPNQAAAQQPAYYDPNPYRSPSQSPSPHTSPAPAASVPAAALTPSNPMAINNPAGDAQRLSASHGGGSTGISPSSTPIDGNKLGLLPKRPVSLLRPDSENAAHAESKPSEDDDLEYVENPFEEGRRK